MTKVYMSLGLISLLIAVGILVDQRLRFGVWWEWGNFMHHETFVGILLCVSIILLMSALSNVRRK